MVPPLYRLWQPIRKALNTITNRSLHVHSPPPLSPITSHHSDSFNYASLLRSCNNAMALPHGKLIHQRICIDGLDGHLFLTNVLVQMYGNCGALDEARALFGKMPQRDRFSWNIVIGAYLRHDQAREALLHFRQMHWEGVAPDKCSFVNVLTACTKENDLDEGKHIHVYLTAYGFEKDVRVGTALVEMYRKCGSLEDVQSTFSNMCERDVFLWNAMISMHVRHGKNKIALLLLKQMQLENVLPDKVIFASSLSACDCQAFLEEGKQIHARIFGCEFESDVIVSTALLNMYGKCGSMEDAAVMFNLLPKRDVISWNSMLAVYAKHSHWKDALKLFEIMLREQVSPDQTTFVSLLDACASQAALTEGKQMHQQIITKGLESDILVSTSLVSMYAKCGNLKQARIVFDKMGQRDIVAWNAMIDAYAQHGQGNDALQLFNYMQHDGVMPNEVTYLSLLQACMSEMALSEGKQMHGLILASGFDTDLFIGTSLVTMYGKCGKLVDARKLFDEMPERNLVSWNAMIAAYAQNGQAGPALQLFEEMKQVGEMPNNVSYLSILSVYGSKADLAAGKRMHTCILCNRFESDVTVGNALISMYAKCGCVEDARSIFDELPERDVVSWTAMILVYTQQGLYKHSFLLFEQMQQNGVTLDKTAFVILLSACSCPEDLDQGKWIHGLIASSAFESNTDVANALINMYGKCGAMDDALRMFDRMFVRDKLTFVSILSVCASQAALVNGQCIHGLMIEDGLELETVLGNSLINMYGKCGSMYDAQEVFDKLHDRDVVSWSTLIATYAQHGQDKDALWLFDQMQHEGVVPNEVTFLSVLSACSHTGLIDEACYYFVSMSGDCGIVPTEDHYNCMIDLLGRSGNLEAAENLILGIPLKARGVPWATLLGACRYHADVARGERAAWHAFELDPSNHVPYVMLANIYATRKNDAAKLMDTMDKGCENIPSIESKGKVHQFSTYDKMLKKEQIYAESQRMSRYMEVEGCATYLSTVHLGQR